MARARTMPRHTAAPVPSVEGDNPPEAGDWPAGSSGPDLRDQAEADVEEPAAVDVEAAPCRRSRGHGSHAARNRQGAHNDQEHHSVFEERSVLDALWSAVVAAPTSITPTMPDAEIAGEPATEPAPEPPPVARGTASVPASAKIAPVSPAVGIAQPVTEPPVDAAEPVAEPPVDVAEPVAEPPEALAEEPEAPSRQAGPDEAEAEEPLRMGPPATILGLGLPGLGRPAAPTNRTIWAGPRHAAPPDWNSTSALLTIETPAAVTDGGLLALRLVVGLTMAAHGAQHAFGMFGGGGLHETAQSFAQLGYQPGILFALAAVVGELFGGLLLAIGLLTPLAAGGIVGVTVNAIVSVNGANGFFATHNGIELPLVLGGAALALLLAGPGRYAADARIPFFNAAAVQVAAASVALFALVTSLAAHLL